MWFWPNKLEFQDALINSAWSFIAWIVWSIIILIIVFILWDSLSITQNFAWSEVWLETSSIFPLILSVITLIATTVTIFLTYKILNLTSANKYKNNIVIFGQLLFFIILTYVFITPIYIYTWLMDYEYIMYIFLIHTLIVIFWASLIQEILSNYRYILIWVYGSFIGLLISIIITVLIFTSLETGIAKLISLVVLLPIINFSTTFFKQLFEIVYFYYNKSTNQDQIWDIFYQIELEEKEKLKEEEEKNSI